MSCNDPFWSSVLQDAQLILIITLAHTRTEKGKVQSRNALSSSLSNKWPLCT